MGVDNTATDLMSLRRTAMRVSISALPVPPPAHLPIHNLTPDPYTQSASTFRNHVLSTNPSIQRRTRVRHPPLPIAPDVTPNSCSPPKPTFRS